VSQSHPACSPGCADPDVSAYQRYNKESRIYLQSPGLLTVAAGAAVGKCCVMACEGSVGGMKTELQLVWTHTSELHVLINWVSDEARKMSTEVCKHESDFN